MKLLQKTIRSYFIYSVIVLLVAVPAFYFVIQSIVREDVDEDLIFTKEMLKPKISDALMTNTISQLKFLDHDIRVSISSTKSELDSFATIELYDSIAQELVPHRVLTSYFVANGQPCMLEITTSLVDNDELIQSIVKVQAILLLLLLAGLFIINRSLSKRIWRPFYSTLDKLRNYKVEQHESLSLAITSVNEFNDLNQSLEDLTDRTHQAYLSQKEFTENASHEMQTPLAVFQSKLELLMQTSPLNEEQADLMSDLANASQRMARLNKSLVLLTKIENNQFVERENILLIQIIEKYIKQFQPQISQKQISVYREFQTEIQLEANNALIETLMVNLLSNAIRHNYTNGSIKIVLQNHSLIIQNTGRPSALDEHKLFMRFQKDGTDSSSIGLGLEIVKQIVNLYGYNISYQFIDRLHSFTVHFKNF